MNCFCFTGVDFNGETSHGNLLLCRMVNIFLFLSDDINVSNVSHIMFIHYIICKKIFDDLFNGQNCNIIVCVYQGGWRTKVPCAVVDCSCSLSQGLPCIKCCRFSDANACFISFSLNRQCFNGQRSCYRIKNISC